MQEPVIQLYIKYKRLLHIGKILAKPLFLTGYLFPVVQLLDVLVSFGF